MLRGLTKLNSLDCSRYLGVIALARVDHMGLTVRPCDGGGRAHAAWTGLTDFVDALLWPLAASSGRS